MAITKDYTCSGYVYAKSGDVEKWDGVAPTSSGISSLSTSWSGDKGYYTGIVSYTVPVGFKLSADSGSSTYTYSYPSNSCWTDYYGVKKYFTPSFRYYNIKDIDITFIKKSVDVWQDIVDGYSYNTYFKLVFSLDQDMTTPNIFVYKSSTYLRLRITTHMTVYFTDITGGGSVTAKVHTYIDSDGWRSSVSDDSCPDTIINYSEFGFVDNNFLYTIILQTSYSRKYVKRVYTQSHFEGGKSNYVIHNQFGANISPSFMFSKTWYM